MSRRQRGRKPSVPHTVMIRGPAAEVDLMMECVDDKLSPWQLQANRRAQTEYNAAVERIKRAQQGNVPIVTGSVIEGDVDDDVIVLDDDDPDYMPSASAPATSSRRRSGKKQTTPSKKAQATAPVQQFVMSGQPGQQILIPQASVYPTASPVQRPVGVVTAQNNSPVVPISLVSTSFSLKVPHVDGILPKRQGKSLSKRRLVAKSQEIWKFSLQLEEDGEISKLIHPAFLTQYKACLTEDDDNCLWNAICLCLGYDERDQIYLREKTAKIIQKHSSHFEQLLAEHMSGLNVKNLVDTCNQSGRPEGWGTEFHILATAILLQRNIYVYSRFKKDADDKMYQDENWDAIKLADHFRNKGSFTIQHCNYQPWKGSFKKKPLCIFYSGNHYTALLPRVKDPVYFQPHCTNLSSISVSDVAMETGQC